MMGGEGGKPGPARMTRRAAAGGIVALPFLASKAGSQSVAPMRARTSMLARDVRNGWGVCGRPGIDADVGAYASMMDNIGTRDVRSPVMQNRVSSLERFKDLERAMAKAGMTSPSPRVTVLVTAYLNDLATTWVGQQPAILAFAASGMLRAIEGPNEVNNRETGEGSHGPDDTADRTGPLSYPSNFRDWAQAISEFRRQNNRALQRIPLIAPSIASGLLTDYVRLPNVSAYVDAGNMHFYAGGGRQPSYSLKPNPVVGYFSNIAAWARAAQIPGGQVWLTETGATTSGNYARDGVSQAKYIANQLFDYFAIGGPRLFYYQLIDGNGDAGDNEGNFGLFWRDGRPKPAAVMLGHLKHLLSVNTYEDAANASDTRTFTPAYDAGALSVSGLTDGGQAGPGYLVMHKSDGTCMIAVWNQPVIDDGKGKNVVPEPNVVTLDFGSVQTFSIHDLLGPRPLTGTTPRGTQFDTGRATTVSLRGYPMLVQLRKAAA